MLAITLDRQSYKPGEEIAATIVLKLSSPVRARGLFASLLLIERKLVKTNVVLDRYDFDRDKEMSQPYSSHMETRSEQREHIAYKKEIRIEGPTEFSSSEHEVRFTLPPNAKPTSHEFGHDNAIHIWKVRAKLDIPMAIDENGEAEVFVEGL